jgi:hypothetical protein
MRGVNERVNEARIERKSVSRLLIRRGLIQCRETVHIACRHAQALAAIGVFVASLAALFGAGVVCSGAGFLGAGAAELRAS